MQILDGKDEVWEFYEKKYRPIYKQLMHSVRHEKETKPVKLVRTLRSGRNFVSLIKIGRTYLVKS